MFDVCLAIIHDDRGRVLLGTKMRGIGMGNVVGVGGKLEAGETPVEALVREVWEESGLHLDAADLTAAAVIEYTFPARAEWSQRSYVFTASLPEGAVAVSSDELSLEWFDAPPYERMWADAREWLPRVLSGEVLDASFEFAEDNATVASWSIRVRT